MINCGISVDGTSLPDYINDVDVTNKINEKTIYYYTNENGILVPSDAGQVILVGCTNFTISNLDLLNVMNAFKSILDKLIEQLDIDVLKLLFRFDTSQTIIPLITGPITTYFRFLLTA